MKTFNRIEKSYFLQKNLHIKIIKYQKSSLFYGRKQVYLKVKNTPECTVKVPILFKYFNPEMSR